MSIHGAREGKKRAFLGMQRRRTVEVPLGLALGHNDMPEPELPFDEMTSWDDAPIYGEDEFQ